MSDMLYYTLTLTALSPVHIGGGMEISKKDCLYMSNERKVYILDNMKVFQSMKKNNLLREYEKYLMDDRQKNFTFFVKDNGITPAEYKSWAKYILPLDDITVEQSRGKGGGSDNIAAFIKDAYGCPYIPGSSLKGALRTAIQNTLIEKQREKFRKIADEIPREEYKSRTKYLSYQNKQLSEELFFTLGKDEKRKGNGVNDIFRGLRVSDSRPLSTDDLILCPKIDIKPDGLPPKTPLNVRRECLRPGTKITFDIEIDRSFIKLSDESIYRALDSFYGMYRKSFLSAFKKVETTEAQSGHIIILGGGAGYASKTSVYPLYKDRNQAVEAVQKIMINTTSTRKKHDPHKHGDDVRKYRVSPHIRKCTKYRRVMYDMGLCGVDIKAK